MDADVVGVAADERGRMHGDALRAAVDALGVDDRDRMFAIVATSGTTNAGVVDDLAGTATSCRRLGVWMHVDGAYGGAGLAAPSVRDRYDGIERADSFIVDPHKWLFAPFDSCALVYRDPTVARPPTPSTPSTSRCCRTTPRIATSPRVTSARKAHRRIEPGTRPTSPTTCHAAPAGCRSGSASRPTAPTRTATRSRRRSRSPRAAAAEIAATPHTELIMEPELSVVLFRRVGWTPDQYQAWSDRELADGTSFVMPTSWAGETVLRICIVNPLTTLDDIRVVIDSLVD